MFTVREIWKGAIYLKTGKIRSYTTGISAHFHTQRLCVKFIVCLKMSEDEQTTDSPINKSKSYVLLDFSLTVNAAPHECVIRTGQQP